MCKTTEPEAYKTPTLKEVLGWIPEKTSLYCVDYGDNLDNNLKEIQECIAANNWELIEDKIDDWYHEQAFYNQDEYRKNLRDKLISNYNLKKKEAKEIIKKYKDEINDAINDRCDDSVVKDLIRNTSKESIYYDTCYEVESNSWQWTEKRIMQEVRAIKKVLKIKPNNTINDDRIAIMVQQASYGGQLVIYFRVGFNELITEGEADFNTIVFKDPIIAIIDTCNGSGDNTDLEQVEFTLPFNRNNLFIDKLDHYSYVYEVCGMCSDWCDVTKVTFSFNKPKGRKVILPDSEGNAKREDDAEKDRVYSAGNCTTGDMNISRHRDTYYRNDYPCGTKCPYCATFWID